MPQRKEFKDIGLYKEGVPVGTPTPIPNQGYLPSCWYLSAGGGECIRKHAPKNS